MRDVVHGRELGQGRDADRAAEELLELAVDGAASTDFAVCGKKKNTQPARRVAVGERHALWTHSSTVTP